MRLACPRSCVYADLMSKMVKAKLRALDLRNEKVHTRWGYVQFDKDGLAELDVPEAELQMLRDIKPFPWLHEPAGAPAASETKPTVIDAAFDTSDDSTAEPTQGDDE